MRSAQETRIKALELVVESYKALGPSSLGFERMVYQASLLEAFIIDGYKAADDA